MIFKSVYVVLAVGIIFGIISFFRLFGFLVPSLVVALISVVAALISFTDVIEITRFKKYVVYLQVLTLLLFIFSMTIWLLPIDLNFPIVQTIGDSFTIFGLGLIIGLYGLKEIIEKNNKQPNEIIEKCKFNITLSEYEEMMKLNDIIERLKKLDQDLFSYNKLHNGWAFFYDSLAEHWNRWKGPFFDGLNRENYYQFLVALDHAAEQIGNIADTDYRKFSYRKVEMWGDIIELTIQPRINNSYIPRINDIAEEINKALILWDEIKGQVNKRYEKERSEQKKKDKILSTIL